MPCARRDTCDAYTEHPRKSWVICGRKRGHKGRHRRKRFKWHDKASKERVLVWLMKQAARRTAAKRTATP